MPTKKTRKAARKTAGKTVKKTAKKTRKKKVFVNPSEDKHFVLSNGTVVINYKVLADIIPSISDEVFSHHVNVQRNDFATWVEDVFDEKELAESIRKASTRDELQVCIYQFIINKYLE